VGAHVKEVVHRHWFIVDEHGMPVGPACDAPIFELTHLRAFFLTMLPDQLEVELKLMSNNLKEMGKLECTLGELVKFYGIILISRLRPHDRRELGVVSSLASS